MLDLRQSDPGQCRAEPGRQGGQGPGAQVRAKTAAPQQRQRPESYRVSLGKRPTGPKLAEGDNRTPEGFYWIDWRKTSNNYNLSMHISYPNARDVAKARERACRPVA